MIKEENISKLRLFDVNIIKNKLDKIEFSHPYGQVLSMTGLIIEGSIRPSSIGSLCKIHLSETQTIKAEVVGFKENTSLLMPLGNFKGIKPGVKIEVLTTNPTVKVSQNMLGRVFDALGNPVDDKGDVVLETEVPLYPEAINAMKRAMITEPLNLGIRALNGLLTVAKGQRVGIMAGSGVGKSVLMGMIAKNTSADINVIALIGERGRELKEFIEYDLGKEGLKRSVVVVATSDKSPLERVRASYYATTIAEYFRSLGKNVVIMMDSLTRFSMAQREIGLAIGEPPTTKGYTPSAFEALPKLLERAGRDEGKGSITGLYTVLVDGDDMNDPIGDAARSILDGHIVLSRDLAAMGHYPAIDVLYSASRVMNSVVSDEHKKLAIKMKQLIAIYQKSEALISIGAYVKGHDLKLDEAVAKIDLINNFLKQTKEESTSIESTVAAMKKILG